MLKGIPGCGKTTWAKKQQEDYPGRYKRVNKDDLRDMLDNGRWSSSNEKMVLSVRDFIVEQALEDGQHVIVDDTNFHPKHKKRMEEIASEHEHDVKVEEKFFDVQLEVALQRNLEREDSVPPQVIRDMYYKHVEDVEDYSPENGLAEAVIVDVDGTLAKMENRSPYEWDRVKEDSVHEDVKNLVNLLHDDFTILVVTGRDGCCKDLTREWLEENNIEFDELYTRDEGDDRKDYIVKKEIFDENIRSKYDVQFVLDDRNQTVRGWRSMGLKCYQVARGNF